MHTDKELPTPVLNDPQHPALHKLQRLAHVLRLISAGYAAWVLWSIFAYWLDPETVARNSGAYFGRDLSALGDGQRIAALGLDLFAWALLIWAVVQCWKFLSNLSNPTSWSGAASRHISHCAWYAIACEGASLVLRPIKSYLLTSHLPVAEQVWKWNFLPMDLLNVLFCLSLLMFAYVFTWTMEVAEENRSFV